MKNILENNIIISTSDKGYMGGFRGFAAVVNKICSKLFRDHYVRDDDNDISVDIDYTAPVSKHINENLDIIISQTQTPVLRIM